MHNSATFLDITAILCSRIHVVAADCMKYLQQYLMCLQQSVPLASAAVWSGTTPPPPSSQSSNWAGSWDNAWAKQNKAGLWEEVPVTSSKKKSKPSAINKSVMLFNYICIYMQLVQMILEQSPMYFLSTPTSSMYHKVRSGGLVEQSQNASSMCMHACICVCVRVCVTFEEI